MGEGAILSPTASRGGMVATRFVVRHGSVDQKSAESFHSLSKNQTCPER